MLLILRDVKAPEILLSTIWRANMWKDGVGAFGLRPTPTPLPLVRQSEAGGRQMPGDTRRGHTRHFSAVMKRQSILDLGRFARNSSD